MALAVFAIAVALGGCTTIQGWFGKTPEAKKEWTPADYYKAAKEELDSGNNKAAIQIFEQLESKFPFGRYAQQAQIEIAYAYYRENETAQCISAADRFIKQHPNHVNVDYALYLKGLANFKEDLGLLARWVSQDLADRDPKAARESFEVFKELVTRFPDSRYAPDSRARMIYLVDAVARHELHVAEYYIKRGAYLAAVNRAQDILIRYPNAPLRRQALDVMVQGYDRMGMTDLRDDTKKVIAKNFPGEPVDARPIGGSWWKIWQY
ncbi:Outer membrane protein assembly factor BamD [Usitatibacter palustris]|uniref:Outer membrane protein assembly factor BamD n=2 Tax=Usitatibacter palustris TaxID=2732487 RepID=A0A6M4H7F4_9PROT|nr:Outer membrane protein assembly factor BamD [Usitatibacter palustris]